MRLFQGKRQRETQPEGDGPHHPLIAWYFWMVRRFIGEEVAILDMVPSWEEDRDWCIFTTEQPLAVKE